MTRLARRVFPGLPHHVTQRGNRREAIFFEDGDHEIYLDLLAEQTRKAGVEVWACCLMPDHVHLFMTPATPQKRGQRRRKGVRVINCPASAGRLVLQKHSRKARRCPAKPASSLKATRTISSSAVTTGR